MHEVGAKLRHAREHLYPSARAFSLLLSLSFSAALSPTHRRQLELLRVICRGARLSSLGHAPDVINIPLPGPDSAPGSPGREGINGYLLSGQVYWRGVQLTAVIRASRTRSLASDTFFFVSVCLRSAGFVFFFRGDSTPWAVFLILTFLDTPDTFRAFVSLQFKNNCCVLHLFLISV